jgi:hypothetical protein
MLSELGKRGSASGPALPLGTTSGRPDRPFDHDCFVIAKRKSHEGVPRRLVLVQGERLADTDQGDRLPHQRSSHGRGRQTYPVGDRDSPDLRT